MPFTIAQAKELAESHQPLLLVVFNWAADGTNLRVSTHGLNTAEGGPTYLGNSYLGVLSEQTLERLQSLSEGGVDLITDATFSMFDPGGALWRTYELGKGFRGATVTATLVYLDVLTGEFSTDSRVMFRGQCDPAQLPGSQISIRASNRVNLNVIGFPPAPISRLCIHWFPASLAERVAAAANTRSPWGGCGYSPDAGFNARGNLISGIPATTCNKTREECIARGMYKQDSSGRTTGSFSGNAYELPPTFRTRAFTGEWIDAENDNYEAKFGQPIPVIYGTAKVEGKVKNIFRDGNTVRCEVLLCLGPAMDIIRVVADDLEIPPATNIDGNPYVIPRGGEILRYNVINRGWRYGVANQDTPYNGQSDPHGSQCVIMVVMPAKAGSGVPRVTATVKGPPLLVPNTTNPADYLSWPEAYTENPAWILFDLLAKCGAAYEDFDIASFQSVAAFCNESVNYVDQSGASKTAPRYRLSMSYADAIKANEAARGIRAGALLSLWQRQGRLVLGAETTLAKQQPTPMAGSNYNTALRSKLPNGTIANGYVAYKFDATRMIEVEDGRRLTISTQTNQEMPNRVSFNFADAYLDYGDSLLWMVDSDDISRMGREVSRSLSVHGVVDWYQAGRVARSNLFKLLRGNPRNDTGGTYSLTWECSTEGIDINAGDIVLVEDPIVLGNDGLLTSAGASVDGILVRVTSKSIDTDAERIRFTGTWHKDNHYVDAIASGIAPLVKHNGRDTLDRASLPLGTNLATPLPAAVSHPFYDSTQGSFYISPVVEVTPTSTLVQLKIISHIPINNPNRGLARPVVEADGLTTTTGGTVPGGGRVYWMAVAAKNSAGIGPVSEPARVVIVSASNTNTATAKVLMWPDGATHHVVYFGENPNYMPMQYEAAGTPATVTVTNPKADGPNIPDTESSKIIARARHIEHGGIWGATTAAPSGPGKIRIAGAGWTTNEYIGRDLTLMSADYGQEIKLRNYRVTANNSDELTVTPDPSDIVPGSSVVIMRSIPTVSGMTISDAKWINSLSPTGLDPLAQPGRILVFVAGPGEGDEYEIIAATATSITVAGPWRITPTSASRYIIVSRSLLAEAKTGQPIENSDPLATTELRLPLDGHTSQSIYVKLLTADGGDNESVDNPAPVREFYIAGPTPKVRLVTADTTVTFDDWIILADPTSGNIAISLLPGALRAGRRLVVKRVAGGPNSVTIVPASGEDIDGSASPISLDNENDAVDLAGKA